MKLPNSKKYLLYIKTAKTGGTSFLKLLSSIKPVKKFYIKDNERILDDIQENDIIILISDNINIFKKKYKEIFDDSYKVLISRNPYNKAISSLNYLSEKKIIKKLIKKNLVKENYTFKSLFNNKKLIEYNSNRIDYKLNAPKSDWDIYSFYTHC